MIVRFDTWERATVFAARMRAEGRHAVMLDEGVCFLWGPIASGGVRVAVSDIVLEEGGEWPGTAPKESELADVVRWMVAAFALGGPLLGLILATAERARHLERRPTDAVAVLSVVLAIAGSAAAFAVIGSMMPAFTRFLRDDERFASRLLRWFIVLLCLAALL